MLFGSNAGTRTIHARTTRATSKRIRIRGTATEMWLRISAGQKCNPAIGHGSAGRSEAG